MSYARGRPTKDRNSTLSDGFECTSKMRDKILELRNDFNLHNNTKMLLFISIVINDMVKYVSMYPEVWFLDCTYGKIIFPTVWDTWEDQVSNTRSIVMKSRANWQKLLLTLPNEFIWSIVVFLIRNVDESEDSFFLLLKFSSWRFISRTRAPITSWQTTSSVKRPSFLV